MGQKTGDGVTIRSQSDHFLERIFGTKADPTHDNRPRSGVKLEDIKDALFTDKSPWYSKKNDSFVYQNDHCLVSFNKEKGKLIQTNPK